jgi:hypothetical protein
MYSLNQLIEKLEEISQKHGNLLILSEADGGSLGSYTTQAGTDVKLKVSNAGLEIWIVNRGDEE